MNIQQKERTERENMENREEIVKEIIQEYIPELRNTNFQTERS